MDSCLCVPLFNAKALTGLSFDNVQYVYLILLMSVHMNLARPLLSPRRSPDHLYKPANGKTIYFEIISAQAKTRLQSNSNTHTQNSHNDYKAVEDMPSLDTEEKEKLDHLEMSCSNYEATRQTSN